MPVTNISKMNTSELPVRKIISLGLPLFAGNGWERYVLFAEFTTNMIFIIGLTLVLVFIFDIGIYGAWIGFALYQFFHALILFIGFISKKWLHVEVEKGNRS